MSFALAAAFLGPNGERALDRARNRHDKAGMEQLESSERADADTVSIMMALGREAKEAARYLALSDDADRTKALHVAATTVRARTKDILAANKRDIDSSAFGNYI